MSFKAKSSLFDDIFQLQSTVPVDIDPEDSQDGFKSAAVTEGATEVEVLGSTKLRKQAAIIPDDPKYRGKKTARKNLYSDDEDEEAELSAMDEDSAGDDEKSDEDAEADVESEENDDDGVSDGGDDENDISYADDEDVGDDDSDANDDDENEAESIEGKKKDAVVLAPSDSNDREKGKAVSFQLGLWDDLIKSRISLQKIVASCNRLPTPDMWGTFAGFASFQIEASDARSSLRQVLSTLLELQQQLNDKLSVQKVKSKSTDSDEEITSESEGEDEKEPPKATKSKSEDIGKDDLDDDDEEEEDEDGDDKERNDEEEDMEYEENGNENSVTDETKRTKRKLDDLDLEDVLAKRHKDFQAFRNATLEKWDEKTRLSHVKVKSKNFAAFDVSVLKQIQQVLGNKDRLIRRIHQNRSSQRILGQRVAEEEKLPQDVVVEDNDDEVELKQRSVRSEVDVNYELVDDSDFYQMCLRDFIQLKQNEETDPIFVNKHWLEIQNLRKKHKRKVDTRASKGRKIRYHVKEKLKNFMAPYDKSAWSDEQKDDLFKALFGGRHSSGGNSVSKDEDVTQTINIGL